MKTKEKILKITEINNHYCVELDNETRISLSNEDINSIKDILMKAALRSLGINSEVMNCKEESSKVKINFYTREGKLKKDKVISEAFNRGGEEEAKNALVGNFEGVTKGKACDYVRNWLIAVGLHESSKEFYKYLAENDYMVDNYEEVSKQFSLSIGTIKREVFKIRTKRGL